MKSWLSHQVLTHPKRLIIVNVLFTILFAYGLKWLVIDDNIMNMLPKDIESRRVWEEVEAEFGSSEIMFIAFGKIKIIVFKVFVIIKFDYCLI